MKKEDVLESFGTPRSVRSRGRGSLLIVGRLKAVTLTLALTMVGLLAPEVSRAQFPGQGQDVFASSSSLCVVIDGRSYGSLAKATDPGTLVGRSDGMVEGTPPDTTGSAVPITGCPVCDASVSDTDMTCFPPGFPETGGTREVHTEMLDLHLCHSCSVCTCAAPHSCDTICYLAGQSAFDALNSIGAAGKYRNSYGEVESKDPAGNPANDFPATSFFDIKGVVTVSPAPAGTSGVFVLADLTDSILMVNGTLGAFPPTLGSSYTIAAGSKLPGGAGGACSICNIPLADAVSGAVVGYLCCPPVHHDIEPPLEEPGCPTIEDASDGSTSGNERAPNSNFRFGRAVYLLTAAELATNRLSTGNSIRAIGWRYATAGIPASGNLVVYLENTADATNTKSTNWSTAIGSMTVVHNASTSIPSTTSPFDITFSGGSSFTYTGGGLYVGFDWQWPGPVGSGAAVACNTGLTDGLKGANGTSAAPTTVAASSFRPETRLTPSVGLANDASVDVVMTLGALPNGVASPHVVRAIATNRGHTDLASLPVTLSVTGAESFTDTQYTSSLAACGGQALVSFAPFTSSALGSDSVRVFVPDDANTRNDSSTRLLAVTANQYSYKQAGSAATGGIGFNAATGQVAAEFSTAVATQVDALALEFFAASAATYSVAIYADSGSGTPGSILYGDATPRTISAAGPVTVRTIVPINVGPGDFYVAVRQTNTTTLGYSYDTESPVRAGTFFYSDSLSSSGPWFDFAPDAPFKPNIGIIVGSCLVPLSVDVTPNGTTSVCAGSSSITFSALTSGGTGSLTYQWTENGIDLPGATSSSVTVSRGVPVSLSYNCRVTDDGGCSAIVDPSNSMGIWLGSGAACQDGNPCTTGEICTAGICGGGTTITPPPEAQSVRAAVDKTTFTWFAAPNATSYDGLHGILSALPVGPGGGDELCFPDLPFATLIETSTPSPGTGLYILVRCKNACGTGTYGTQSSGAQRITTTCP